jgi:hypothetical protein
MTYTPPLSLSLYSTMEKRGERERLLIDGRSRVRSIQMHICCLPMPMGR